MARSLAHFVRSLLVVPAVTTACALAACSSTTVGTASRDGGTEANDAAVGADGVPTETNAPLGAKCHCSSALGTCCAAGLLCRAPAACNVVTANGCYTEGTCAPKSKEGEPCDGPADCAVQGSVCVGEKSGRCFLSPSATVRCSSSLDCPDGRTCVDSYCKVVSGGTCFETTDCASHYCTGGKCE
jgi:hypothetical protein